MTDVNDTPPNGADALNALFDAARAMRDVGDTRPNDVAALQALLEAARADHAAAVAERDAIRAERDQLAARNEKLEAMITEIRRAHFGRALRQSVSYLGYTDRLARFMQIIPRKPARQAAPLAALGQGPAGKPRR